MSTYQSLSLDIQQIDERKTKRSFVRTLWLFFFPHTVTKLVVNGTVVASATTYEGPDFVDVETFLSQTLGSLHVNVIENNVLMKSMIHRSLGSKKSNPNASPLVTNYLNELYGNVIVIDLLLCACLLESDSLQLTDGRYFQTSKILVT